MKRTLTKYAAVLGLLSVGISAREIRTPLPWQYGFGHFPLDADYMCHEELRDKGDCCWAWDFKVGGILYGRDADCAFVKCCPGTTYCPGTCGCDECQGDYVCTSCPSTTQTNTATTSNLCSCCDHGGSTTHKVPWVTILFGKSDFRLEEIFVDGDIGTYLPNNPWVSIATLKPRFEYREAGAFFMADFKSVFDWCDADYRLGLRARLPVRDISVTDICAASDLTGETLDDVWQLRNETSPTAPDKTNVVYAGRLDFLSTLKRLYTPPNPPQDLVVYHDANHSNHITMNGSEVGADVSVIVGNTVPCIEVIYRGDERIPASQYWGRQPAVTDPIVQANGTGLTDDQRGRFNDTNVPDYTALGNDTPAQAKLFVVPSLDSNNDPATGATKLREAIEVAIQNIDASVADFLEDNGVCVCDGRTKGLGDLDLEFYLGRNWGCENQWWTDLQLACRFPTGKEICNCKYLFKAQTPLGNNHHFEIRAGGEVGWDACDWVKFMIDGSYSWVLKHCEKVAAPFKGATIQNIGPCVNAEIKWQYFVGHADISFFANDCCGCDIGYELYHKKCDDICLCDKTATDLAGRTGQLLDASVLSANTSRTAHKICTGVFTKTHDCEIAAGFNTVVAGKNAPRDTDYYVALNVTF